jgi:hypothetical protein
VGHFLAGLADLVVAREEQEGLLGDQWILTHYYYRCTTSQLLK